jgi:hypothetical protein
MQSDSAAAQMLMQRRSPPTDQMNLMTQSQEIPAEQAALPLAATPEGSHIDLQNPHPRSSAGIAVIHSLRAYIRCHPAFMES